MQQAVIALIVAVAAGYVIWTLMPARRRQRVLDSLATHGLLRAAAARHRTRMNAGGCSRCSAAGGHAPPGNGTPRV